MTLGERLRRARENKGYSQEELGELAGCGQGVVSKIERGDQGSTSYVVKLATACGVRPEWLDDGSGEMTDGLYVEDPKLKVALVLMQELPEYAIDAEIERLNETKKLIQQATETALKQKK